MAADVPNTKLINFVDTPVSIQYSASGDAFIPLASPTQSILDVTGFRRVSILVGATKASSYELFMGKISGATLSNRFSQVIDQQIHTYEVVGPEINLNLRGPAKVKEKVQLWVYLRS
ncbi:MAG TPA: hypothetical protein VL403_01750 [Candidatus Kryptonia bacterium]|nr:hypothetical protein [Candidatus Kryptonia bacterium]